jgi:hypothetical protein
MVVVGGYGGRLWWAAMVGGYGGLWRGSGGHLRDEVELRHTLGAEAAGLLDDGVEGLGPEPAGPGPTRTGTCRDRSDSDRNLPSPARLGPEPAGTGPTRTGTCPARPNLDLRQGTCLLRQGTYLLRRGTCLLRRGTCLLRQGTCDRGRACCGRGRACPATSLGPWVWAGMAGRGMDSRLTRLFTRLDRFTRLSIWRSGHRFTRLFPALQGRRNSWRAAP